MSHCAHVNVCLVGIQLEYCCCFDIIILNANMSNRKSCRGRRRTLKRESLGQSNGSSGPSEVDSHELKAKAASPMPSREASVDHSEASLIGDMYSVEHINQEQEQVSEIVRSPLQNHDRIDLGRRYCLLTTVHEAKC